MKNLQLPSDMLEIVISRANEMLKEFEINKIYQSFKTEDLAKEWLIKTALATLIVPVENR